MEHSLDHIITHPGGAHKDEFLACCLILAQHAVTIYRREPESSDLKNPSIAVVDIGHLHEPELNNFDHHQFPYDHEPICSLSLILQNLNLYEDAQQFCEWLKTLEWFDSKGAVSTAKWLEIEHDALRQLNSPVDVGMLRQFSNRHEWNPGDPLWEVMKMLGEGMLNYLSTMHDRMEYIQQHREIWKIDNGTESIQILFMPRTDPLPAEPSLGLGLYLEQSETPIMGMVYPDRRGSGYGLSRFNDYPDLDFNRVGEEIDVHFAHVRGFLAKSTATDKSRLQELVRKAWLRSDG